MFNELRNNIAGLGGVLTVTAVAVEGCGFRIMLLDRLTTTASKFESLVLDLFQGLHLPPAQ